MLWYFGGTTIRPLLLNPHLPPILIGSTEVMAFISFSRILSSSLFSAVFFSIYLLTDSRLMSFSIRVIMDCSVPFLMYPNSCLVTLPVFQSIHTYMCSPFSSITKTESSLYFLNSQYTLLSSSFNRHTSYTPYQWKTSLSLSSSGRLQQASGRYSPLGLTVMKSGFRSTI